MDQVLATVHQPFYRKGDQEQPIPSPISWSEANARLIAAAPRILAALKDVLRHPHIRAYLPYDPLDPTFKEVLNCIKAAEGKE